MFNQELHPYQGVTDQFILVKILLTAVLCLKQTVVQCPFIDCHYYNIINPKYTMKSCFFCVLWNICTDFYVLHMLLLFCFSVSLQTRWLLANVWKSYYVPSKRKMVYNLLS